MHWATCLMPLRRWGAPVIELTEDEVTRLAEREHERWRADRQAAAWTWAPTCDNVAKHNPLLVAWSELSDDARRLNVDACTSASGDASLGPATSRCATPAII